MFAQAAIAKVALSTVACFAAVVFAAVGAVENATAYVSAINLIVSERMTLQGTFVPTLQHTLAFDFTSTMKIEPLAWIVDEREPPMVLASETKIISQTTLRFVRGIWFFLARHDLDHFGPSLRLSS